MINPQSENGHIDINNESAERFAKLHLSGNEWQILWVVLRKTWGWHKKIDSISLGQFQKYTGMNRNATVRSITKLVSKKILLSDKSEYVTQYSFNKHYDQWEVVSKTILVSKTAKTSIKKATYKRQYTKENNISPLSSKTGCVPCTRQEVLDICKKTGATIQYVHRTNERIANLIEDERFVDKRGRKYKTVYRTLIDWVTRFPETPGFKRSEFENLTFDIDSERYLNKNYYLG